jgi:hypothetical protein
VYGLCDFSLSVLTALFFFYYPYLSGPLLCLCNCLFSVVSSLAMKSNVFFCQTCYAKSFGILEKPKYNMAKRLVILETLSGLFRLLNMYLIVVMLAVGECGLIQ